MSQQTAPIFYELVPDNIKKDFEKFTITLSLSDKKEVEEISRQLLEHNKLAEKYLILVSKLNKMIKNCNDVKGRNKKLYTQFAFSLFLAINDKESKS